MATERVPPQTRRFGVPANGAKRGVRLEWDGKRAEIDVPVLPFQTIETINEPRGQMTLFSPPDDPRPAPPPGWKNKLIWGDNKLAMTALMEQFAGQVDLIYIDPPFDTGADFSTSIEFGDEAVMKEPSIIERHAYQDTWGRGLDSYLQWLYETSLLLRQLLAPSGSFYIHLDDHVSHYAKAMLDEIFGEDSFVNEIVWKRSDAHNDAGQGAKFYGRVHDVILYYVVTGDYRWRDQFTNLPQATVEKWYRNVEPDTGRKFNKADLTARKGGGNTSYVWNGRTPPPGRFWAYSYENMQRMESEGRLVYSSTGMPYMRRYLDESKGVPLQDWWDDISMLRGISGNERLGYPTQKPEPLLERIIKASSNPGDLVLDCFLGSGTTAAVAEKLGRRWIGCDLGRFAIHTTRKRLLDWEGPNGERCRPFEILNIGHYERAAWQGFEGETTDDLTGKRREQEYIRTLLTLYHATPLEGGGTIHGKKETHAVHVGPLDSPVSRMEAYDAVTGALALGYRSLDILGWEWDFEANETVKEEARARGVTLRLIQVPEEMLDGRARKLFAEGKLTFPELASLEADVEPVEEQRRTYRVRLTNFIIPPANLPEALRERVTRWQDYIDYWSVDWRFGADTEQGKRDTFHNMWQKFRTKKHRTLPDVSEPFTYDAPGTYTVMVKVVDIFGNDTTVSRKVEVR